MDERVIQTVCVVGLGKIGLPLAVQYARRGFDVIGVDINQTVVDQVNAGEEPFPGETDLALFLKEVIASGRLRASTSAEEAIGSSSIVVIVVPLIVDDESRPDFRIMDLATSSVAGALKPGTLVLYETTLPVGTTRDRFLPALQQASGLTLGLDLFVAFSPERVYSGRIFSDLKRYPKLVGGLDSASTVKAIAFYQEALEFDQRDDLPKPNGVWNLVTAEAAELAKLAETTYRDINIGFANELARYSDRIGVDVYKVIDACNSQPFSQIHQPGIAVGGHCIPVYPRLYLSTDPTALIPAAARETNEKMPSYAIEVLQRLLRPAKSVEGLTVVILGAAYRGGVKETAFSGIFPLVNLLRKAGAEVMVHDPLFSAEELSSFGWTEWNYGDAADACIIQTDHQEYRFLSPDQLPGLKALVDGRKILSLGPFLELGISAALLGSPSHTDIGDFFVDSLRENLQ
jgi:UDP-N-acetyl-D-glucosamine dehydrogenase